MFLLSFVVVSLNILTFYHNITTMVSV